MASVSSLDKDLRNMRLSKYTPKAANEIRDWIEESLGERLDGGDLLESLRDGVALCKLVNLAVPRPGVKYKASKMPFVQMENISHFLRACQLSPLNLQPHDVFLTVDLYESKDPAQVLQCIIAFSRVANAANPSVFRRSIGPKSRSSMVTPETTGTSNSGGYNSSATGTPIRTRGESNASQGSATFNPALRNSAMSPSLTGGSNSSTPKTAGNGVSASPKGPVSSWSKRSDEGATAPAWNIHQYGYMGGASQGNQGIAFGARRQITSPAPSVPSLADKEKRRREEQVEAERRRHELEEEERRRAAEEQANREAEEESARVEEEQRWEEEAQRQREFKRLHDAEAARKRADAGQRQREDDGGQKQADYNAGAFIMRDGTNKRADSDARLQGQFLSQYRAEQRPRAGKPTPMETERRHQLSRVEQLELELAEAREREMQQSEVGKSSSQQGADGHDDRASLEARDMSMHLKNRTPSPPSKSEDAWRHSERDYLRSHASSRNKHDDWRESERDYLRREWSDQQETSSPPHSSPAAASTSRPLPDPTSASINMSSSRPLPDPASYAPSRTDTFLFSNPAPRVQPATTHFPSELSFSSSSEQDAEDRRRVASQQKTKAGGWASKSLLEREMEMERERQREWEESQRDTREAVQKGVGRGVKEATVGEGGSWDVNQYGWTGGDSQNRGGAGIGAGRRQIIGPRPRP